jgi:hypothetical protein
LAETENKLKYYTNSPSIVRKIRNANLPVIPRFEEVAQILCHCEQLKCDIMSYHGEKARSYREVFATDLLPRANGNAFQLYILKLCMLLHNTQDYYFKQIIEDIIRDSGTKWREDKSKVEVTNAAIQLHTLEKEVLDSLRVLRDKFIAHRDFYRELENAKFDYADAWRVLKDLQDIYNVVNLHAFNTTMHFGTLSDREPGEYRHLSRFAKLWQKLRPEWSNPRDNFTHDLIYISWGKTPPGETN